MNQVIRLTIGFHQHGGNLHDLARNTEGTDYAAHDYYLVANSFLEDFYPFKQFGNPASLQKIIGKFYSVTNLVRV